MSYPVSLIHPARCEHDNVDAQGSDHSVGFDGGITCEDCGADVTDDPRYERDEWGDDCDRAYEEWKDRSDDDFWQGA